MSTAVFEPTRKILETAFKAAWGSTTPIRFDNVAFDQPANAPWVSFLIRFGTSDQDSIGPIGTRLERHFGAIIVQVFVPKDKGSAAVQVLSDQAGGIFRMKQLVDSVAGIEITTRTPQAGFTGIDKELYQQNVNTPMQIDSFF